MGAKYLPTTKDLAAGQRFQKRALTASKFIKPAAVKRPPLPPQAEAAKRPPSGPGAKIS
jgi:hypothetical protein